MNTDQKKEQPELSSVTIGSNGLSALEYRRIWTKHVAQHEQKKRDKAKIQDTLYKLLESITPIDFRAVVGASENSELRMKHFVVATIDELLKISNENDWGICVNNEHVYVYNGMYWKPISMFDFKVFLGRVAEVMGVPSVDARHYVTQDHLYRQFLTRGISSAPSRNKDAVLINLINGTYEITGNDHKLRAFRRDDFLTYQLPFRYDKDSDAPTFKSFLNQVLPDEELQQILAEYIGYVFAKNLKLDKFLVLYGTGANGKSVFYEIITALLGKENVSNYSLKNLNEEHNRALIMDKLLNYGSEINASIEHDIFKTLVSGEPIQARLKYQNSMMIEHYARLCFNCNELPSEVEHTDGYYRRFLIVPFEKFIPETDRDPELAQRIISGELSGVFNWVLQGLDSLLKHKRFTESKAVKKTLQDYKLESDPVLLFLEDTGYHSSDESTISLRDFYTEYVHFCISSGYHKASIKKFSKRLRNHKITVERSGAGGKVYVFVSSKRV